VAFSNGKKAFCLPVDVRCALRDMTVTSEKEQIPSGEVSRPADTDPRVDIQRKEWMVIAADFCRRQKCSYANQNSCLRRLTTCWGFHVRYCTDC